MKVEQLKAFAVSLASTPRLLRLPEVLRITGLGRSTLYRMIAEHRFPAPVQLSKRAVAWREDEVRPWADARPRAVLRYASDR
jgi:prophage regulatory protein